MFGPYFQTRYSFDKRRDVIWKEIASFLQRFIPTGSKILDLGAGYCNFINNIKACNKHALDIEEISSLAGLDVKCHQLDAENINRFEEKEFDVIFASNFFEHFTILELKKIFKNLKKILNINGRMIIIQPNFHYCYKNYFDDYTHKSIFTHQSFCDFLKVNNFKILICKPKFLPFSLQNSKIPIFRWMVWLYLRSPIKLKAGQMLIIVQLKSHLQI